MGRSRLSAIARRSSASSTVILPSAPMHEAQARITCFFKAGEAAASTFNDSSSALSFTASAGCRFIRASDHRNVWTPWANARPILAASSWPTRASAESKRAVGSATAAGESYFTPGGLPKP